MRPEWQRFWKETGRNLIYIPLGMLISFIPFLINYSEYRMKGTLLREFLSLLFFGLYISTAITLVFMAAYTLLTIIYIKTRIQLWNSILLQIAIAIFATVIAISSALFFRARLQGKTMERAYLFEGLLFGGFIAVVFLLYSAYQQAHR